MFRALLFSVVSSATFLAAATQPQPFHRPLVFEPNLGQAAAQVKWLARGPGYQLFFTGEGITMMIQEGAAEPTGSNASSPRQSPRSKAVPARLKYSVLQMKLTGGRPWENVTGLEPTGGVSNYIRGKDGKNSLNGVPNYARVSVASVYDGVDLVFYSHEGELEYDFVVNPGADPKQIKLAFEGTERMRVDRKSGDLVLTMAGGSELRHVRPKMYQQVENRRVEVAGGYQLLGPARAAFTVASYDRRRPLVIDPFQRFLSSLGGSKLDFANAIAVDSVGNSYVTGGTASTDFPVTDRTAWLNCNSTFLPLTFCSTQLNIFTAKLSPTGQIIFSTYGGVGVGHGIAVDSTGVYITGEQYAFDCGFACTPVGFGGGADLFISKLSQTGAGIYDRAIAGSGDDIGEAIAVDSQQNAWVAGATSSFGGVPKNPPFHALVAKYGPSGQSLYFQTFGSDGVDYALGISVDPSDQPWVTGSTCGNGWPTTDGIFHSSVGCSVFVMQLSSAGSTKMSAVFGGSTKGDAGTGITNNGSDVAYVVGYTNSASFPTSAGAYQTASASNGTQAFVTEVESSTGVGRIGYSTLLGGDGDTLGYAIVNRDTDELYVAGYTTSSSRFPGIFAGLSNTQEGFMSKLSLHLDQVDYTELRGASLNGIALLKPTTPGGIPAIFVAGQTSTNFASNALIERIDDEEVQSQALWQNPSTGELFAGLLDAQGNVTSTQKLSVQCSPSNGCSLNWKVIGTLDANRDGVGDILLYNATGGQLQAWLLDSSGAFIGTQSPSRLLCGASNGCSQTWKPVGVGDFNHDGIDDVLWHNETTGELQAWLLNGAGGATNTLTLSKRCAVTDGCWTRYKLIAIGDFDGDGIDDLFWLDTTTGAVEISLLNGSGGVLDTRVLANRCGPSDGCSTTWKPIGIGDVNHDGRGDLLWENPATGELLAWLLNGTDRILTQSLSLRCTATSGCPVNALPVGIQRKLQAAP